MSARWRQMQGPAGTILRSSGITWQTDSSVASSCGEDVEETRTAFPMKNPARKNVMGKA